MVNGLKNMTLSSLIDHVVWTDVTTRVKRSTLKRLVKTELITHERINYESLVPLQPKMI